MAPLLGRQRQSGMLGFCCCFQHLLWLALDLSASNAHSCWHWKHTTILTMVFISIISLILVMCIIRIIVVWLYSLKHFRLAGICRFPCPKRARLQDTNSLRHSYWKYPGKTACCSSRRHRNHSPPPAHSLSGSARRPPAGFRRRMQDVACQLMVIGMVPRYVMKAKGVEDTVRHGVLHGDVVLLYQLFQLEWNHWKQLT